MVFWFVLLYLLVSLGLGILASFRVSNSADYAIAGRSLPLFMVVTTTFATWFGSETVLGASAVFLQDGLGGVVEDPFGASFCLVLVGLFFAARLYKLNLLTIGDYYRERYGPLIEILMSIAIIVSYLGWVAAQVKALGLVFHMLDPEIFSQTTGMFVGMAIVTAYTLFGGMWSVAVTDFFQMVIIVAGLLVIAYFATDMAGGVGAVVHEATSRDLLQFLPPPNPHDVLFFIAALLTMMLGSIPQQDVYQRVMSSKDVKTARRGPVIGGLLYLLFAFIPMYIGLAAFGVMPASVTELMQDDPQKVLPMFILGHMPVIAQVFFFGALLSAIMSTASATLLAPSTTFAENILRHLVPKMSDKRFLLSMRLSVMVFSAGVLAFALTTSDSIYEMVAGAYTVTLVGAFVPLLMGLYWKRATTQGALLSSVLGIAAWLAVRAWAADDFPPPLAGLLAGFAGIWIGSSLLPQVVKARSRPALHPEQS